jgi:alkanesulfonate monooxygenase SsuD/methylene tetrahydromethanopterin reductase-like flavin-dependent oxidoreductase (luciferase family)
LHIPSFRARYGLARMSPLELVRDYLQTLRPMLRGERVSYDGVTLRLADAGLSFEAPGVPVYMSATGPRMLELAGELSDGVCLNWCTSDEIARSRATVEAAAARARRPEHAVQLVQSIRVSLDADQDVARRRLARTILNYALARAGSSTARGYRGHFARMGFDAPMRDLERMRELGATDEQLADAFPAEILRELAYFGDAAGARAAIERLARGLDLALVRPVVSPGDADAVAAVFSASAVA